jgi:hypothetical protein
MEKQFFCPLECAMSDGETVCCSVSLINITHMTVIIHHSLQLYDYLPRCRNYFLVKHHEYSSMCKCLSCPATVLLSSQPWPLHEYLPISVSLSWVPCLVACLYCSTLQSHNSKFVSLPSCQIVQGKKINCPSIICAHILCSSSVLSLSHGLLSCAVLCAVRPSPSILSCHLHINLSLKV